MQKLSRQFVVVADEVHDLYPEDEWSLNHISKEPRHIYFKTFGEAMPESAWNHPGTKQGVYMIGPHAEYLGGGGAISGNAKRVTRNLEDALERWNKLRKKKKYANKKVPQLENAVPKNVRGKPFVFRVFLRDLPRARDDESGRRFRDSDLGGRWMDFTKWAWNVNWINFDDPEVFLPSGKKEEEVSEDVVQRLCRRVLVDNVRGQTPAWKKADIQSAKIMMKRLKKTGSLVEIEYYGSASMKSKSQSYKPKFYGRSTWNKKTKSFESFQFLAIGDRSGAGRFNQRKKDKGTSPMGILLSLFSEKAE